MCLKLQLFYVFLLLVEGVVSFHLCIEVHVYTIFFIHGMNSLKDTTALQRKPIQLALK